MSYRPSCIHFVPTAN